MKKLVLSLAIFSVFATHDISACTGMKLTAKDGSVIHGRTLEFGEVVDITAVVIPRGYAFTGTTPGGKGLQYTAKYATVGAIAFDDPAIMDGMNEKGLSVGTFYFPTFAGYATITSDNQSKALSPIEFPNWIVTQFATIDEVKAALDTVVIAPTVNKNWGPVPAPFHYIVYDKSGKALVIEPVDGKLVTHDNPVGTFTNSPQFEWHMENLRNYINLTPFNAKPVMLNGIEFSQFGQGSGMVGMPGDFTPPSRFVRATIFSATAEAPVDAEEGVFQLFHILNQFDIPVGSAKAKVDGVVHSDYTQMTCVRDPGSLKFFFRTYNDQTIRMIDLSKFDPNAKALKKLNVTGQTKAIDISSQLR
ncbi:MAG: choloylglycine hydrolase family protein [Chlamydiales bacterium]|nr:choloylglycine hydrolase family protein [Chlamydiales bacterium]